jgi:hypothetical protein
LLEEIVFFEIMTSYSLNCSFARKSRRVKCAQIKLISKFEVPRAWAPVVKFNQGINRKSYKFQDFVKSLLNSTINQHLYYFYASWVFLESIDVQTLKSTSTNAQQ